MDTLGWVVPVEDDDAVTVGFGSRKVRILSPFAKLTQALIWPQVAVPSAPVRRASTSPTVRSRAVASGSGRCV
jgi:hypothetical protein